MDGKVYNIQEKIAEDIDKGKIEAAMTKFKGAKTASPDSIPSRSFKGRKIKGGVRAGKIAKNALNPRPY